MESTKNRFRRTWIHIQMVALVLLLSAEWLPAEGKETFSWRGTDGRVLPFTSPEEVESFLRTATVIDLEGIKKGTTNPKKLLLERDGLRMHAIFRSHDEFKGVWQSPSGPKINFRDSCYYELAAYRLSKLLGIPRVPPVVERTFERENFQNGRDFGHLSDGRKGTLQAWVEGAITEIERRKLQQRPPDFAKWHDECQMMFLFDSLTYNEDRNLGNILIGPDWKIWLIDSTRSFRPFRELRLPEGIKRCNPEIWERMQKLQPETLRQQLGDILSPGVLDCLIARHLAVIEYLRDLIAERGESVVVRRFGY